MVGEHDPEFISLLSRNITLRDTELPSWPSVRLSFFLSAAHRPGHKWQTSNALTRAKRTTCRSWAFVSGKSKWGLSNGSLRPLSAICAQSSTIVHFCGLFGPLSKGNFRRKMTTIVGNRGQLWTSTLSPHLESPHLDFPDCCILSCDQEARLVFV